MAGGVIVAEDGAFGADAGVVAGVEVDDLGADVEEGAVGERDGFGF